MKKKQIFSCEFKGVLYHSVYTTVSDLFLYCQRRHFLRAYEPIYLYIPNTKAQNIISTKHFDDLLLHINVMDLPIKIYRRSDKIQIFKRKFRALMMNCHYWLREKPGKKILLNILAHTHHACGVYSKWYWQNKIIKKKLAEK